jgi:hypothetical protein
MSRRGLSMVWRLGTVLAAITVLAASLLSDPKKGRLFYH